MPMPTSMIAASDGGTTLAVTPKPERLVSLDAYRGAIMVMMASGGLGLARVAEQHPDSATWQAIARHVEHASWAGFTLWDVIQPAFMFMVGVALAFSVANRRARGAEFRPHVSPCPLARRRTRPAGGLSFVGLEPTDGVVVCQRPGADRAGLSDSFSAGLYQAAHPMAGGSSGFSWPIGWPSRCTRCPRGDFDWAGVGVPADWPHLTGFAAHWEKNANFAATVDQWFLNLFPRQEPFVFNRGGYATLNFVPSIATMAFGLLAGGLLRREISIAQKLWRLVIFGILGVIIGTLIAWAGLCPIVKRIWTPSWTIASAGVVTLLLAGFVAVIEGLHWKRWAFPFVVVGLNPITLYCLWQLGGSFIRDNLRRHLGQDIFEIFGPTYTQTLQRASALLILWLVLLWMYRRKIFLRI